MPAVELLLARQLAGKHTVQVGGSLPVTFMPGAVMADASTIAAQMSFSGGVLTVPFQSCLYQVDNTDSTDAMIVQCSSGDPGARILGGYTALLFCNGVRVTAVTTMDVQGYVMGEADAVASALGVAAWTRAVDGASAALGAAAAASA